MASRPWNNSRRAHMVVRVSASTTDAANAMSAQGVTEGQVRSVVEALVNEGHLYSTIDDDHFKAT